MYMYNGIRQQQMKVNTQSMQGTVANLDTIGTEESVLISEVS